MVYMKLVYLWEYDMEVCDSVLQHRQYYAYVVVIKAMSRNESGIYK